VIRNSEKLTAVSLFSGAGGFDLGFHLTDSIRTLACYELNETFAETLNLNISKLSDPQVGASPEICIEDLSDRDVVDKLIQKWKGVDIVFGGPPCQSFSIMGKTVNGKKLGANDSRGSLVYSFLNVVEGLKPRAFLFENVPNITNIDDGLLVEELKEKFSQFGYKTWSGVLSAADFGAHTFRKRFFIVGFRDCQRIEHPVPTHSETPQYDMFTGKSLQWNKCGRLFELLEEAIRADIPIHNHEKVNHKEETVQRFDKLKFGETDNVRKRNRLDPNRPSHSVYVGGKTGKLQARTHIHPYEPRELTARECALIQGFPLDWVFAGRQDAAVLQAANAVPVQLAESLGNYMARSIANMSEKSEQIGGATIDKKNYYA
jgi:DNA (cytosine-5)-methyltransferase 1